MSPSLVVLHVNSQDLNAIEGEPSRYHRIYAGDLMLPEAGFDGEFKIGEFQARTIDVVSAIEDDYDLFAVFDEESVTYGFFDELFGLDFELKPAVKRATRVNDFGLGTNLLILERLEILPAWRGQGHGHAAMIGMMRWFRTGMGLIALKAFPLQFESGFKLGSDYRPEYGLEDFKINLTGARAKLMQHYANLGFKRIGKRGYMVRSTLGVGWPPGAEQTGEA